MSIALRRPPTARELGIALGVSYGNVHKIVTDCARYGLIDPQRQRQPHQPFQIVLTPMARIRLELPLLVYLAWPLPPPDSPDEAHEAAHAVGINLARWVAGRVQRAAPVSPYLVRHDRTLRAQLDAAAPVLALGCHAAIIYRDQLLAGRADGAAAFGAGLPTSLIDLAAMDSWQPDRDGPIWQPPYLLTR